MDEYLGDGVYVRFVANLIALTTVQQIENDLVNIAIDKKVTEMRKKGILMKIEHARGRVEQLRVT